MTLPVCRELARIAWRELSAQVLAGDVPWQVLEGDSLEVLRELPSESVHAVVCDPPYGLEFMGKDWDRFRIDDPGTSRHRGERAGSHGELIQDEGSGHPARNRSGVAYGGGQRPTTYRCTGCGKRDQFRNRHESCGEGDWRKEIIDPHAAPPTSLAFQEWCRAWGLEAKRVLKPGGHLLAFGGTRTYHRLTAGLEDAGFEVRDSVLWLYGSGFPKSLDVAKAIDKAAGAERQSLGRSPNSRLAQPLQYGGGNQRPNQDGVHFDITAPATPEAEEWQGWGTALKPAHEPVVVARKPPAGSIAANVLEHGTGALNVDGCRIPGDVPETAHGVSSRQGEVYGHFREEPEPFTPHGGGRWPSNVVLDPTTADLLDDQNDLEDGAGVSRFFYVAKASQAERSAGLVVEPSLLNLDPVSPADRNSHPTVKPLELMRHLVRLVTPPGGVVLDPFAGSGSTGCAAVMEGFRFLGVDRDPDYPEIARARIAYWSERTPPPLEPRRRAADPRPVAPPAPTLFEAGS